MKKGNRNKYKLDYARVSPFNFGEIKSNRQKVKP